MADALVTIKYSYPSTSNKLEYDHIVEIKNVTFMQLMPQVVDIADDQFSWLPNGCRIKSINISWEATP